MILNVLARRAARCIIPAAVVTVAGLGLASAGGIFAQSSTGVMPNWSDLETWSRLVPGTRENELGLGLQLSGTAGPMLLSFSGRLDTRSPTVPPKEVAVIIAPGLMANPNALRTPTLRFTLDEGLKTASSIDATSGLRVDDPAPGAIIHSAATSLRAAEFIKLCTVQTLKANVFGFDVQFRADQIKGMRALAERLHLPLPKPTPPSSASPARGATSATPPPPPVRTGPIGPNEQ
jgi:hypothetical protein